MERKLKFSIIDKSCDAQGLSRKQVQQEVRKFVEAVLQAGDKIDQLREPALNDFSDYDQFSVAETNYRNQVNSIIDRHQLKSWMEAGAGMHPNTLRDSIVNRISEIIFRTSEGNFLGKDFLSEDEISVRVVAE